jgi:hypothetical protein
LALIVLGTLLLLTRAVARGRTSVLGTGIALSPTNENTRRFVISGEPKLEGSWRSGHPPCRPAPVSEPARTSWAGPCSAGSRRPARAAADAGVWDLARRFEAALIRDVFGNPFRRPPGGAAVTAHGPEGDGPLPPVSPAVRAWHGGLVVALARGIYADRRFADLPVLADALEEAGCSEAHVLGHLRGPGPHVRGGWALDAVLAKED